MPLDIHRQLPVGEERRRGEGRGAAGGGALAGLSSYAFADAAHWHAIYYLGALVPLLALPGIIFGVPNLKPLEKRKEDKPSIGLALFGAGFIAFVRQARRAPAAATVRK